VQEQLASTVIDLARAKSRVLQAGAQTLAMQSDSCRIARLASDPTLSAVGELAVIPTSDASFDSILLVARKYGTIVQCSAELLSDSPNAGSVVMDALTNAVSAKIDDLLLNGDGVNFIGLMGDASIGETGSVGGIQYEDLLLAQWSIRNINGEPNAVILNPKSTYALSILRDVPTGSFLQPPPALSSLAMLDTTRQLDTGMIVGDFSKLIFGVRQSLVIATSDVAGDSFKTDATYIKAVFRADAAIARPHFHRLLGLTY
jgi:HK97 family phage major capsid protein